MAETVYDYMRTDTLYGTCAVGKLAADITTHPWITETLISVTMPDADNIAIKFTNALSTVEKARVDGMVVGHEGTDLKFKRLASRGVAGLEVSLNDGSFAPIDGFVIDPLELTNTVARLKVRLSGEWKANGAGASLQVIETVGGGGNENKFAAAIAVTDTGGAWAVFTVDSDVALRAPGAAPNRYRLDGKRSGGTAASIRYCELALIWV